MTSLVEDKKIEIAEVCQRYGVERLDLFGSAAGEEFDPGHSDLDFVVAFERREPQNLFDRYFGLKEDLENLFDREVDLVMEGALHKDKRFAESLTHLEFSRKMCRQGVYRIDSLMNENLK